MLPQPCGHREHRTGQLSSPSDATTPTDVIGSAIAVAWPAENEHLSAVYAEVEASTLGESGSFAGAVAVAALPLLVDGVRGDESSGSEPAEGHGVEVAVPVQGTSGDDGVEQAGAVVLESERSKVSAGNVVGRIGRAGAGGELGFGVGYPGETLAGVGEALFEDVEGPAGSSGGPAEGAGQFVDVDASGGGKVAANGGRVAWVDPVRFDGWCGRGLIDEEVPQLHTESSCEVDEDVDGEVVLVGSAFKGVDHAAGHAELFTEGRFGDPQVDAALSDERAVDGGDPGCGSGVGAGALGGPGVINRVVGV